MIIDPRNRTFRVLFLFSCRFIFFYVIICFILLTGAGSGTFANTFIPPYTWLGEYEGEIFPFDDEDIVTEYCWQIYRNDTLTHYIDAARIETSNWVRWVNCPRNALEENVKGVYCLGKVYYVSFKPILPGQELFVYYGDDYAEVLGIDPEEFW